MSSFYGHISINDSPGPGPGPSPVEQNFNPVRYIDYDGTIVASYSVEKFMALNGHPANPSHTGLTAQGWNWNFSEAQEYVDTYGMLDIGQMYITSSGATEIDIELNNDQLNIVFSIGIVSKSEGEYSATINWGDGNTVTVNDGENLSHTYATGGEYTIQVLPNENTTIETLSDFDLIGVNINENYYSFPNAIKAIRIGRDFSGFHNTFYEYWNLKTITIPNTYDFETYWPAQYLFGGCGLVSIVIPDNWTDLPDTCFQNCVFLKSISLPNNPFYTYGGQNTFTNTGLERISLPPTTYYPTYLDDYFKDCKRLKKVILAEGISSISSYMFQNCTSLTEVFISSTIDNLDYYSFSQTGIKSIIIPATVEEISYSAFQDCEELTSVIIQGSETRINESAFKGCIRLLSITLPSDITIIDAVVFKNCENLATITIPSGVTQMGVNALNSCYNLQTIHMLPTTPPTIEYNTLDNTYCVIYVPSGSLSAYQSASYWSDHASQMVEE